MSRAHYSCGYCSARTDEDDTHACMSNVILSVMAAIPEAGKVIGRVARLERGSARARSSPPGECTFDVRGPVSQPSLFTPGAAVLCERCAVAAAARTQVAQGLAKALAYACVRGPVGAVCSCVLPRTVGTSFQQPLRAEPDPLGRRPAATLMSATVQLLRRTMISPADQLLCTL